MPGRSCCYRNGQMRDPISPPLQNTSPKTLKALNTTSSHFVNWIGPKRHLLASRIHFREKVELDKR